MKRIRKTQATLNLPTLKLEGGLFLPDQLEKLPKAVPAHSLKPITAPPKASSSRTNTAVPSRSPAPSGSTPLHKWNAPMPTPHPFRLEV